MIKSKKKEHLIPALPKPKQKRPPLPSPLLQWRRGRRDRQLTTFKRKTRNRHLTRTLSPIEAEREERAVAFEGPHGWLWAMSFFRSSTGSVFICRSNSRRSRRNCCWVCRPTRRTSWKNFGESCSDSCLSSDSTRNRRR